MGYKTDKQWVQEFKPEDARQVVVEAQGEIKSNQDEVEREEFTAMVDATVNPDNATECRDDRSPEEIEIDKELGEIQKVMDLYNKRKELVKQQQELATLAGMVIPTEEAERKYAIYESTIKNLENLVSPSVLDVTDDNKSKRGKRKAEVVVHRNKPSGIHPWTTCNLCGFTWRDNSEKQEYSNECPDCHGVEGVKVSENK